MRALAVLALICALLAHTCAGAVVAPKLGDESSVRKYSHASHSFAPPFNALAGSAIPNWDYGGSTVVTSSLVRLTPDLQSRSGFVFNTQPCYVHNWEVTVDFRVHGSGRKTFGDGFAVFYIADALPRLGAGPVFGAPQRFKGLAVIFDSFDNNGDKKNPLVQVMIGDGSTEYDSGDGVRTEAGTCQAAFRDVAAGARVQITYDEGTLSVELDVRGTGLFEPCVRIEDVDLPVGYNFAAGAMTGDVHDNHEILGFSLVSLGGTNRMQDGADPSRVPAIKGALIDGGLRGRVQPRRSSSSSSGGGGGGGGGFAWYTVTAIVLVVVFAAGALGMVLFSSWRANKRRSF